MLKGSQNYHRLSQKLIMWLAKLYRGLCTAMKIFKHQTVYSAVFEIKLIRKFIEISIWKGNNLTAQSSFFIKAISNGAIEQLALLRFLDNHSNI